MVQLQLQSRGARARLPAALAARADVTVANQSKVALAPWQVASSTYIPSHLRVILHSLLGAEVFKTQLSLSDRSWFLIDGLDTLRRVLR